MINCHITKVIELSGCQATLKKAQMLNTKHPSLLKVISSLVDPLEQSPTKGFFRFSLDQLGDDRSILDDIINQFNITRRNARLPILTRSTLNISKDRYLNVGLS